MGKYQKNIEAARRISVVQYLETYHPGELVRKTDKEYCTKTHSSLVITPANGLFHWFSQSKGGNNALDYLVKVEGMDFVSAVRLLNEMTPMPVSVQTAKAAPVQQQTSRPFVLPPADRNAEAATAYLMHRGISPKVLRYCVGSGILYQTTRGNYRNCVFVGKDAEGVPRSAFQRCCQGGFRGDAAGSQKQYGFVVTTVATVDNMDYESVWSNEAHYRADEAPYIGSNGNWWVGGTDTGVKAAGDDGKPGKDGETPYIGENGNWWIGFTDTKVKAAGTDGKDGEKGEDGETPYIGENGNWWIGATDTGVKAAGTDGTNGTNGADGLTPSIGENGNWWIGTTDTGVKAAATDGADGKDGADGTNGVDGRTPQLKIGNDNLWYVSYDNGQNWESLNVKATGEMGATGAQGEQGIQGAQGEKGDKGDQGEQGIQGVQGEKGDQGEQGIQGVQGEKGDKGDQGEQGIQGVQGEKGDAGADGASGQNGTNGINGKNGVNGQDGQNGQDGKDGQDGTAGRGIDNAMIDNDGYLILTMTDGTTINAGLVRDTSAVANKEANDSATAKSLATAAVGLSGASLLWNIAMLALSITMKRKYTTFHR